jgi:hypothetical protein
MLDRVAMHQTRLRLPGLGIDAKGVVLGGRGLVLLASLERLVAFLSLLTSEKSLGEMVGSLRIEQLCSKLGTRELAVSFAVHNSEALDPIAEVARIALGHTFTGTSRHFVQFRDAAAPFGYDTSEVIASDADYVLYHSMFTQLYARERSIELSSLLLRLRPRPDPCTQRDRGPMWLLAEEGLGPAWIQYLIRSRVEARTGVVEWPPLSALEQGPVLRFLFHIPTLPDRMLPLARTTPGLGVYRPCAPGVAVQIGYRHPITLRACPVFNEAGLVLMRGDDDPVVVDKLPLLGEVQAFARMTYNDAVEVSAGRPLDPSGVGQVKIPIRLAPTVQQMIRVRASFIAPADYPILRQMLYSLGRRTLQQTTIAFTQSGAVLINSAGVESTPVGVFLREIRDGLFVAAGYDLVPDVDPEVVHRSLGSPTDSVVILMPGRQPFGVSRSAFLSLEQAMIEGQSWAPLTICEVNRSMDAAAPQVSFELPSRAKPSRSGEGPGG